MSLSRSIRATPPSTSSARAVQLAIEYDPKPPFNSGSAATATDDLRAAALALV